MGDLNDEISGGRTIFLFVWFELLFPTWRIIVCGRLAPVSYGVSGGGCCRGGGIGGATTNSRSCVSRREILGISVTRAGPRAAPPAGSSAGPLYEAYSRRCLSVCIFKCVTLEDA